VRIAALALSLFLLGCGTGPGPVSPVEFPRAKGLVVAALNAWKEGRTADLTVGGRPLRFEDEDARAGLALVSYQVREPPAGWTEAVGLAVTLSLRDAKGRRILRHAEYLVTPRPDPVVRRED
jgi:hypothetical protein